MEKEFSFLDPGPRIDGNLALVLLRTVPADPAKDYVPFYSFQMQDAASGQELGQIEFRVGFNDNIRYGGHIGYSVLAEHRGHNYAARSLRLLFSLVKAHGMKELWVTCNPDNLASQKTCVKAGGELKGIVNLPSDNEQYQQGERQKCLYIFKL